MINYMNNIYIILIYDRYINYYYYKNFKNYIRY